MRIICSIFIIIIIITVSDRILSNRSLNNAIGDIEIGKMWMISLDPEGCAARGKAGRPGKKNKSESIYLKS